MILRLRVFSGVTNACLTNCCVMVEPPWHLGSLAHVDDQRADDAPRVDTLVLVEALVLSGDDGLAQLARACRQGARPSGSARRTASREPARSVADRPRSGRGPSSARQGPAAPSTSVRRRRLRLCRGSRPSEERAARMILNALPSRLDSRFPLPAGTAGGEEADRPDVSSTRLSLGALRGGSPASADRRADLDRRSRTRRTSVSAAARGNEGGAGAAVVVWVSAARRGRGVRTGRSLLAVVPEVPC